VRYNPFEEEGDYNEGANCEEIKYNTAWAFVPANITLRDNDQGSIVRHYDNVDVTVGAGWGHVDLDYSGWQPGEPDGHCTWLAFYDNEKQWEQPAIGGWCTNRHNFGRPDTESRKPQSAGAWPKPYEWEVAASFKNANDGQYIPYPAQGGWLEITIYQGVNCYAYGEESMFAATTKWTERGLYDKVRWLLYQAPQVEIVKSNLTLESATMEDIEYTGLLHPDAKDEIAIDTICGTANPIKAIGPQKAVVIAVSIPVAINNRLRVSRTFTPRFSAYRFPNNKAFKGLINMTDKTKPAVIETTNTGNCPEDTPLKFPNPQII